MWAPSVPIRRSLNSRSNQCLKTWRQWLYPFLGQDHREKTDYRVRRQRYPDTVSDPRLAGAPADQITNQGRNKLRAMWTTSTNYPIKASCSTKIDFNPTHYLTSRISKPVNNPPMGRRRRPALPRVNQYAWVPARTCQMALSLPTSSTVRCNRLPAFAKIGRSAQACQMDSFSAISNSSPYVLFRELVRSQSVVKDLTRKEGRCTTYALDRRPMPGGAS